MMRAYRKCNACGFQDVAECPNGSFSFSGTCKCGAKMDIQIGSKPDWFVEAESVAPQPKPSIFCRIMGILK